MAHPLSPRLTSEVKSSLDESTYDLLSDISSQVSDDGRTTSVTSTDDRTDDVHSLAGSDTDDEDEGPMQDSIALAGSEETSVGMDSAMTTRALSEPSIPTPLGLFEESRVVLADGEVELSQTLIDSDNTIYSLTPRGARSSQVNVTVKQTLSDKPLALDRILRLLYIGDDIAKPQVISKLKDAFGDCAFYHEQVTDVETVAVTELVLDNGARTITFGPRGTFKGDQCQLPDIAVFCHSPAEHFNNQTSKYSTHARMLYARETLRKNHVPVLDISLFDPFEDQVRGFPFLSRSMRIVFETRRPSEIQEATTQTFPVTLQYFSDMDSATLSQHLSCIISSVASERKNMHLINRIYRRWREADTTERWQMAFRFISFAIFLVAFVGIGNPMQLTTLLQSDDNTVGFDTADRILSSSAISTAISSLTTIASQPASQFSAITKSLGHPVSDIILDMTDRALNNFEVQPTEGRQIVVKLPHRFSKAWRTPKLFANVTRDGEDLKKRIVQNDSGSFTITVEEAQAYGMLNVTVWSSAKPSITQSTEINLGNRWTTSIFANLTSRYSAALDGLLDRDVLGTLKKAHENTGLVVRQAEKASQIALRETKSAYEGLERGIQQRVTALSKQITHIHTPALFYKSIKAIKNSGPVSRAQRRALMLVNKAKKYRLERSTRRAERAQHGLQLKQARVTDRGDCSSRSSELEKSACNDKA